MSKQQRISNALSSLSKALVFLEDTNQNDAIEAKNSIRKAMQKLQRLGGKEIIRNQMQEQESKVQVKPNVFKPQVVSWSFNELNKMIDSEKKKLEELDKIETKNEPENFLSD